jgi:hypothetical protein
MDTTTNHLDEFLSDVGFPLDKAGLVQEAYEFPLPQSVREAIALLPDREYHSREEVKTELLGAVTDYPEDSTPKKDIDPALADDLAETEEKPADLEEFTQMGDEEDHESV